MDRTPNALLRQVRKSMDLSLDDFACAVRRAGDELGEPNDCSKRHVVRWESGETRTIRPIYRRALRHLTGRTFEQLGFVEYGSSADLSRRDVLVSVAATGLPQVAHMAAGRRVGASLVEQMRARTVRLRRLDDYLGGADTYRVYAAEVEATAALVEHADYVQAVGRDLMALLAEQAQQAGWAAFDIGDHQAAHRHYMTSLSAASTSGANDIAANSLAYVAYQLTSTGRPAAEVSTASCRQATGGGRVRALLHSRAAYSHARAGDITQAQRDLDIAAQAITADASGAPDWAAWVDGREVAIMAGRCWAELHRPLRAIAALEPALANYDPTHARDRALYSTWLADAYVDAGEPEQAAAVTLSALDIAAGVGSTRPVERAAQVVARLAPHRRLPLVAEAFERCAEQRAVSSSPG